MKILLEPLSKPSSYHSKLPNSPAIDGCENYCNDRYD